MYCQCGCGLITPVACKTRASRGVKKGQHLRFINGHNSRLLSSKEQSRRASYQTGKSRYTGKRSNYVKYKGRHMHRYIMEKHLGRKLKSTEVVHHIDHDKWNNDISNLAVMTQSEHARIHRRKKNDNISEVRA